MAKKENKGFGKKWKKEQDRLGTFTPLEAGTFPFQIVGAEIAKNKAGNGRNFIVEYEELKGPDKGSTFRQWYSFENPNEETEDIAAKHISSLCDAIGINFQKLKDPKDVLKKKLNLTITVSPGSGKFGPVNNIVEYLEYSSKVKKDEDEPNFDEDKKKKDKKDKKKDKKKK